MSWFKRKKASKKLNELEVSKTSNREIALCAVEYFQDNYPKLKRVDKIVDELTDIMYRYTMHKVKEAIDYCESDYEKKIKHLQEQLNPKCELENRGKYIVSYIATGGNSGIVGLNTIEVIDETEKCFEIKLGERVFWFKKTWNVDIFEKIS